VGEQACTVVPSTAIALGSLLPKHDAEGLGILVCVPGISLPLFPGAVLVHYARAGKHPCWHGIVKCDCLCGDGPCLSARHPNTLPPTPASLTSCSSLFEKDKLLFAFLLCVRILEARGTVDGNEWAFLLTGGLGGPQHTRPNPAPTWLVDRSWRELVQLAALPAFAGLDDAVEADPDGWRPLYDSAMPHRATLPGARAWGHA
jgi:hypothetical protein